jgi:8-oxo-dGTP diphosphatase
MQAIEKRPRVGVGVIVQKEGKILLGKRKGSHGAGHWSCPGGHLEFGETVEQCAARELLEETGLKATSLVVGPWTNDLMAPDKHYITLHVFVSEFEGEPKLMEQQKCEGWHWFEWNQLPEPLFLPTKALIGKLTISLSYNRLFSIEVMHEKLGRKQSDPIHEYLPKEGFDLCELQDQGFA